MFEVVYRWKVAEQRVGDFVDAWEQVTRAMEEHSAGSRGALLIRSQDDPTVFVAVAEWYSEQAWKERLDSLRSADEALRVMQSVAHVISVERFARVSDIRTPGGKAQGGSDGTD
jgi:heme-degrading monooxygenase HmoA